MQMSQASREMLEKTRQDLSKAAQRMEGSSESQIYKAIQANRYNSKIPGWLRPILFPLSIFALFATELVIIAWVIQRTDLPVPWDVSHPSWIYWHLLLLGQVLATGVLYYSGERYYGKLPGIPRGSLFSLLVVAALLPGLILALVIVSHVYARLQLRKGQSGVWLRSLGGWNSQMLIVGGFEVVLLWLVLMLQGMEPIGPPRLKNEIRETTFLEQIGAINDTQWFPMLVATLGILGLVQALGAAILLVCEVAVEEEAADVTPLLGSLAPLAVLSPVGIFMLITYMQSTSVHEVWLALMKLLGVVWVILVLTGSLYVAKRWFAVYQPFIIMIVGYLMMAPFFVDHIQDLPTAQAAEPTEAERTSQRVFNNRSRQTRSPRAIDMLRSE
uniref:Uncharacterized protein n=2 Tax=Rubinisphaera brasiliensis TaxID=119 RepID=F0SGX6_RUBBR|nr:hypothetical protein Plabr_1851 [Rubinisphaera brasiliensis DSM 5305]